ncbi:hypothetical protein WJX84_007165 [Apatococcus fuscideae]|uniref:Uncharacterized protein n=1 Tax=Apatococcus fuscideae TaxID=2026836 RepID=A0AAW1STF1_9CHLO
MPGAPTGAIVNHRQPGWLPCAPYFFGGKSHQFWLTGTGSLAASLLEPLKVGYRYLTSQPKTKEDREKLAKVRADVPQRHFAIAEQHLAFCKLTTEYRVGQNLRLPARSDKPDFHFHLNSRDVLEKRLSPRAAKRYIRWSKRPATDDLPASNNNKRIRLSV